VARLRCAVIGGGYLGRFHAQKYAGLARCEFVGVVDPDAAARARLAAELGVATFADHRELPGRVDAVSVATPTVTHCAVTSELLAAGIHVLVEKPIAAAAAEATAMIELARRHRRVLQVGHLERFNPAVEAVETIISDPRFLEVQRLGSFSARSLDVNVVLDLMIHDLDIILALIKDEVAVIRSSGIHVLSEKIDIANARLEFKSGCVATLTASRVHQGKVRKLRIFEPTSYYSIDYIDQEVKIFPLSGRQTDIKTMRIQKEEPLKKELQNFCACIAEGRAGKVSGEEGLRALRLAYDVLRQIETA